MFTHLEKGGEFFGADLIVPLRVEFREGLVHPHFQLGSLRRRDERSERYER